MIDTRIIVWLGSMTLAFASAWGVVRYKTKKNSEKIKEHNDEIKDLKIKTENTLTIIEERIPKDLKERLGRIEEHLKQINHGR
jgi:hypothetical protein